MSASAEPAAQPPAQPSPRTFTLDALTPADRDWVEAFIQEYWGAPVVVSRGRIHEVAALAGFAARRSGQVIGLVTYHIEGLSCEVVSLDSLEAGSGVGSALMGAVEAEARRQGCRRLWLITTNDNTPALRWYQKRGLRLAALHPGAIEHSRRLKPEIPLTGIDGIPIRDEIELEKILD